MNAYIFMLGNVFSRSEEEGLCGEVPHPLFVRREAMGLIYPESCLLQDNNNFIMLFFAYL